MVMDLLLLILLYCRLPTVLFCLLQGYGSVFLGSDPSFLDRTCILQILYKRNGIGSDLYNVPYLPTNYKVFLCIWVCFYLGIIRASWAESCVLCTVYVMVPTGIVYYLQACKSVRMLHVQYIFSMEPYWMQLFLFLCAAAIYSIERWIKLILINNLISSAMEREILFPYKLFLFYLY